MCSLVLGEVAILADLVQDLGVDTLQVNGSGGSDDISGVYPSQRNAVDFEGTGDEEDTLGKVLEENDTLAAETTGEEDDDGAGLERGSGFRRTDRLAGLVSQLAELSRRQSQLQHDQKLPATHHMHSWCRHDDSRPILSSSSRCVDVEFRSGRHTFLGTATSSAG